MQHDLNRFITDQDPVFDDVLSELKAGQKQSHWMWFIFPQIHGLGHSEMAKRYAIKSTDEARAYLNHPILGRRLLECTEAVKAIRDRSASEVFGCPDDMKFRSSLTLFASVAGSGSVFHDLISKYYKGKPDEGTLELLQALERPLEPGR